MSSNVWLGVDIGTTGIRCVAFDSDLKEVGSHYEECAPRFLRDGIVEQDPEEWVRGAVSTMAAVMASLPYGTRVRGVSLSTQSITLIPIDADGEAMRPAISWLDQRGQTELPALATLMEPGEIRRRTGKPFLGAYWLPKLLWLRRHEPDVLRNCRWLLGTMDYVLFRFTGRVATEHTLAGGTMLYNNALRDWDDDLLAIAGVNRDTLPEILTAGTAAGGLSAGIATMCGLPADIPVAVGAQDQKCAALAAGLAPGTATISLGTAAAIEHLQSSAESISVADVATFSFLFEDTWVSEGVVATAGAAVRWFSRTAAPTSSLTELGSLAAASTISVAGPLFLPMLSRVGVQSDMQKWRAQPAGVFWGLTLDTSPGDMFRAVLEGITFECALLLERMRHELGDEVEVLRLFGGGAASSLWCQLFADVTGLRVEVPATRETAAAGAALLAGMGTGAWEADFGCAAGRLPSEAIHEPGTDGSPALLERRERYGELRATLFG